MKKFSGKIKGILIAIVAVICIAAISICAVVIGKNKGGDKDPVEYNKQAQLFSKIRSLFASL